MATAHRALVCLLVVLAGSAGGAASKSFTISNSCKYTVWPGILSSTGSTGMDSTGFALAPGESRTMPVPSGWSGRLWGRTPCSTDDTGKFTCVTGDCGSGRQNCAGGGAAPPATLAEFTMDGSGAMDFYDGSGAMDFYDVSLVDGYNLPVLVAPWRVPRRPPRGLGVLPRRRRRGVQERVRGVRVGGVLLQRGAREPQHVQAVGVLAVLQERVPEGVQLRVRRRHLHLHLRRRRHHHLRHHLLPQHHQREGGWRVEPAGAGPAADEQNHAVLGGDQLGATDAATTARPPSRLFRESLPSPPSRSPGRCTDRKPAHSPAVHRTAHNDSTPDAGHAASGIGEQRRIDASRATWAHGQHDSPRGR